MDAAQQDDILPEPADVSHIPVGLRANAGKGRIAGSSNLVTRETKQVAAMLVQKKADQFEAWIDEVGKTRPAKACEIYLRLVEIVLPARAQSLALGASITTPDGQQTAVALRMRGLLGLPLQQGEPG